LLSILAMVAAALLPLAATSQILPLHRKHAAAPAVEGQSPYKYEVYAGYGYTSINQINGSRYGLQGPEISFVRDFGKHLGLMADGAYYKYPLQQPVVANLTLSPAVDAAFIGPVFRAKFYGKTDVFVRGLLGAEHISGTSQTPNVSLAGGAGVGMDYNLSPHLLLRAAGDDIASSFSLIGNNSQLALSPHRTRSSRATFGVVYKF
jgi:hypothetical protein